MTSSARKLLAVAAVLAVATVAPPSGAVVAVTTRVPPATAGAMPSPGASRAASAERAVAGVVAARVRDAVATRWAVEAERVEIEWGLVPAGLDSVAPLELAGRGTDGWFHAVFGEGPERAVLRLRAGVRETTLVSARALAAGERLAAADLRADLRPHWGPPFAVARTRPGPGWEVRRPVAAGEALDLPTVAPPPVIAAGEPVEMVWTRGLVRVSLHGVAMHAARRGDAVRVRVGADEGRRTGIALAPGVATLGPGDRR